MVLKPGNFLAASSLLMVGRMTTSSPFFLQYHIDGQYEIPRGKRSITRGVPVSGGGDTAVGRELERVHNAENLVKVTASGRGIGDRESNLLGGINDEHAADGGLGGVL